MCRFIFGVFLLVFMSSCASVQDRSAVADGDKIDKKTETIKKPGHAHPVRERP